MAPPKRCLYETLGVDRNANDGEIKKAYRTQALANHPDKNRDRRDEAEEMFKEIQHAYHVLSDAHERAWYDSHRNEILRGKDPSHRQGDDVSPASATNVDIFSFFSANAYTGFEGPESFFTVMGNMFDELWREECEEDGSTSPSTPFGGSDAEWATVRDFYQEWESFSSRKSFSFADKWNLPEAPNRETRRLMERENKRERARAKKEFNSTVRELVAFVKKRDPRIAQRRDHERQEKERLQKEAKERSEQRAQERQKEQEQTRAARDEALEEDAAELDEILASIALDEQKDRRRGRRRHRTEELQASDCENDSQDMQDETGDIDGEVDLNDGVGKEEHADSEDAEDEFEDDELYCAACRKPFRSMAQKTDHERSKKHKAAVAKLVAETLASEKDFLHSVEDEGEEHVGHAAHMTGAQNNLEPAQVKPLSDDGLPSSSSKKKKKKKRAPQANVVILEDTTTGRGAKVETGEKGENPDALNGPSPIDRHSSVKGVQSLSKRERRKMREQRKKDKQSDGQGDLMRCNTCGADFPSRTKLMRHVTDTGHARHIE